MTTEQSIHTAFRELAQRLSDEHNIQVERVVIDWMDLSTYDKDKFVVLSSRIETQTRGK